MFYSLLCMESYPVYFQGILHWTRDNDGINEERFKMQQRAPIWLALNLKFGTIAVKILPLGKLPMRVLDQ